MKNWFSNCFPLLYICLHCDEVCVCWHFGAPGIPGFSVRAQHDPEKMIFFFIFFILTQKVLIRLLLYLTCKLILNRRYMWTKMGPVWLLNPPPPRPGPHIAKDVNMFSHICKTYYPLFFLVVHMYPVWWGLHDTLVPLDSIYASPGPPKMKQKFENMFIRLLPYFTYCWALVWF